jgi:hypothetical protein
LAHARHATSAKASHVTSAKATSVTSAAATHGTCAEAATATEASAATTPEASASAATTTAAARLCTRCKQRSGQQRGRQYHHRSSSSHDIFLSMAGAVRDRRTSRVIIERLAQAPYGRPAANR